MTTTALSRFNAGIQISEHGLNSVLKALSDFKVIPSDLAGSFRNYNALLGLTLGGNYNVSLATPEIFLDTNSGDRLGVRGAVSGEGKLELSLDANGGEPANWSTTIGFSATYELITQVSTEKSPTEAHLAIRFVDLTGLTLNVTGLTPENLGDLIQRLTKRFVEVHLLHRVIKIPLTPWFSTQELGGWALEPPVIRVIDGPQPNDLDSLTVAFNTWPNRSTGNAAGLTDWVHGGSSAMVGVAVDERLFIQALQIGGGKLSVPKRFNDSGRPDERGEIELSRIVMNLRDGYIHVSVEANVPMNGKPLSVFAHSKARIAYKANRFHVDVFDVDVELPWFVHLVGFLLFRLYYLLIMAVVQSVLGKSLANIGEDLLEDFLNGGAVPLSFDTALGDTMLRISTDIVDISIAPSELRVLANLRVTSNRPT